MVWVRTLTAPPVGGVSRPSIVFVGPRVKSSSSLESAGLRAGPQPKSNLVCFQCFALNLTWQKC